MSCSPLSRKPHPVLASSKCYAAGSRQVVDSRAQQAPVALSLRSALLPMQNTMMDLDYLWYFCNGSRSGLRFHTLLRKMNLLNDTG
jgi:hypothetical protein